MGSGLFYYLDVIFSKYLFRIGFSMLLFAYLFVCFGLVLCVGRGSTF